MKFKILYNRYIAIHINHILDICLIPMNVRSVCMSQISCYYFDIDSYFIVILNDVI